MVRLQDRPVVVKDMRPPYMSRFRLEKFVTKWAFPFTFCYSHTTSDLDQRSHFIIEPNVLLLPLCPCGGG